MGDGPCQAHGLDLAAHACDEAQAQERAQVLQKARELAPFAYRLVDALGTPSALASDHCPEALALAYANRRWLLASWCPKPGQHGDLFFWACPRTGAHGWACRTCLGLVQLG